MTTADFSRTQMSQLESTKVKSKSPADSVSSKTIKRTTKLRNFGWLVKGIVKTHQSI